MQTTEINSITWGREAISEIALRECNGKGLVLSQPLMVIECHMLSSDSVILAWHELDECISHKSDKPLPFLEQHLLRCLCRGIEKDIV